MTLGLGAKPFFAVVLLFVGAATISIACEILPSFGLAVLLSLPRWLVIVANGLTLILLIVLAFVGVVAVTGWAMNLGRPAVESGTRALAFSDYLASYGSGRLAPNLDESQRQKALAILSSIADQRLATVLVPCEADGSSDRIVVVTGAKAGDVRVWADELSADHASRLNKRETTEIKAAFPMALGRGWCIVWD